MARRGKTRYHEAGHAVVAHMLGFKVLSVEKGIKGKTGGLTKFKKGLRVPVEQVMAVNLAGDIAEKRYSKVDPQGGGMDLLDCLMIVVQLPEDRREDLVKLSYCISEQILDENWDLVEEVAQLMYDNEVVKKPFKKLGR